MAGELQVEALLTEERKEEFIRRYVERWNHWESPVTPEDAEEVWDLVEDVLRGDPNLRKESDHACHDPHHQP